jgi:2-polyprenyl-3-methyl-5-hydroxy-6-metoxy-1,4-benzoquinol methylase
MRYGLIPTGLIERVAVAAGKVPVPMLDAVLGPLKARAIMAGVSLGVFEALREGERTAQVLARQLDLDADALELLLRTLVVCDYLVQRGDGFGLSRIARRSMVTGAPMQMVGYLLFNYAQWEIIGHLETLVQTGRGSDFHQTMTDSGRWCDYQLGMLEIARIGAPIVAGRVPVPRYAVSLLDVGGGHGLFGAAVCRQHPPMRCTVLDLPQAIRHAGAFAARAGLRDVMSHQEGDLLASDFGCHDVLLLFSILHHFSRDCMASVLARAHRALRADGTVAIWELEPSRPGAPATRGDPAALFFRLTSTAGAYHGDVYAQLLREAGFRRVAVMRPASAPGKVLVTGRR